MRENMRYFIQKAVVTNNHGNIWACQVMLIGPYPILHYHSPWGVGGNQETRSHDSCRVWNNSVLWSKERFQRKGSRPFFQQQQRWGVIASLRDVHYYPGLQGWLSQNLCMGASARGKETNFNVLGIIRWVKRTPFLICLVMVMMYIIRKPEHLLTYSLAKELSLKLQSITEVPWMLKINFIGSWSPNFLLCPEGECIKDRVITL